MWRAILFAGLLAVAAPASAANPLVEIRTSLGPLVLELLPDKAPKTVAHFLGHVDSGYYRNTVFHRVVERFLIQGGGFTADLSPKPADATVENEATNGLENLPGTIAMAREFEPHSARTQFFINLDHNRFLNHHKPQAEFYGFAVFGRVVRGMEVVEKIAALPTGAAGPFAEDVPRQPVIIEEIAVIGSVQPEAPRKPAGTKARQKRAALD